MINDFEPLQYCKTLMRDFPHPWFIGGGWALELAAGKKHREHDDLDICVFREHVEDLLAYFADWEIGVAIPGEHRLEPVTSASDTLAPRHELHMRRGDELVEFLLVDRVGDTIPFRRYPGISISVDQFSKQDEHGFPYVAPEWQLLFKAKDARPKDDLDFDTHLPLLDLDQKKWLMSSLIAHLPHSAWISKLEEWLFETVTSPTIARLEEEIRRGNADALDAFWERLQTEGGPLIEAADEEGQHYVTFIYQGDEETENVLVVGGPIGTNLAHAVMSRLLDTNLWYKTIQTVATLPTVYYLSKNDTFGRNWGQRHPNLEMDKLNPHTITFLPNPDSSSEGTQQSLLQFPSEQIPYVEPQEHVATGNLQEYRVKSQALNNERSVWVYTPAGYSVDHKPYGLLLVHDGFAYTTAIPTPTILDNLIAEGKIPPLVAVFVNSTDNRMKELGCDEGYADLIIQDVLPLVREKYHVTNDPSEVITAGSSMGGLISMYLGFAHPDVFGNVLSQSGSYWWAPDHPESRGWLIKQFAEANKRPLKIYMDYGHFESILMIELAQEMHQVLTQKNYDVHLANFPGGHDYPCWAKTIADGLIVLAGKEEAVVK